MIADVHEPQQQSTARDKLRYLDGIHYGTKIAEINTFRSGRWFPSRTNTVRRDSRDSWLGTAPLLSVTNAELQQVQGGFALR